MHHSSIQDLIKLSRLRWSVFMLPTYGCFDHAQSWDPSDRGRDAGSLPSDLKTRYAHYIPGTQDEAAGEMDDILTPIPIALKFPGIDNKKSRSYNRKLD